MKNKRGFTLIELLAVIIILGVIMLIAIPSVTKQITNSRKKAYVNTAKEVVNGARTKVNEGDLEMYDTDTTYYIPVEAVPTENSLQSPYGEFTEAYVGVIYTGSGYKYYWISTDKTGQGIKDITDVDKLEANKIVSNIKDNDIKDTVEKVAIGDRNRIKILDPETGAWIDYTASGNVSEDGGTAEISQIPSCPGCVFLFSEEEVYTTWNTRGEPATVLNPGDYETDYRNVQRYQGLDEIFIGVKLNSNNQVERAYACGVNGDAPICIEGTKDGSKFTANQTYLRSVYGIDDSNTKPYGCNTYYDDADYCHGGMNVENHRSGTVWVGTGWFCSVVNRGFAYCGMND